MSMSPKTEKKEAGGGLMTIIAVLGVSVVLGAGGFWLGMTLSKPPADKPEAAPVAADEHAAPKDAHGAKADGGHGGGHGAPEKAPAKPVKTAIKELAPIVTNLSDGASSWIRLQVSVVYDADALPHPEIVMNEVTSDIVAYLRSLSLRSIEGAAGLRRLSQELSERASVRSEGAIRELIIQSLVVQ
jgi:flagellar basal body-associated protein FliL